MNGNDVASTGESGRTDVVIVGAGMAGLSLAAALASVGIRVAVVDRAPRRDLTDLAFDGRTAAIAYGCRRIFEGIGVWDAMAPHAEPILDIRVTDGDSPLFVHYDHREVGDEPLGHIVENRVIREALLARLDGLPSASLMLGVAVSAIERSETGARVLLEDGRALRGALAVGADGRDSRLRTEAGIRLYRHAYGQTAIVCTAAHAEPHHGVAHERFLPGGPFAILPFLDDPEAPNPRHRHRSSIVWTERTEAAELILALPRRDFVAELARRIGDFLGPVDVTGPVWRYPLGLQHAARFVDRRLALIGDAAHVIHPLAGQGFNLGLRDAAVLAEELADASRLGLDLGASEALERFERRRRLDVGTLTVVTDGLNRLFSNDLTPLRIARGLGLAAVNRTPPLRRLFMRHAMGAVGDLPRLARGRAL
jgi:2-octaprenyl-6-methoxyphenol hydroxylase